MPIPLSPNDDSLPHSTAWMHPRLAADAVVARCRQTRGFQAEHDFWIDFARIYTEVENTVRPEQRFAFSTEVDERLAQMGLATWSIMSHLGARDDPPSPWAAAGG